MDGNVLKSYQQFSFVIFYLAAGFVPSAGHVSAESVPCVPAVAVPYVPAVTVSSVPTVAVPRVPAVTVSGVPAVVVVSYVPAI